MFELESFLIFIFIIGILIYRDRKNIKLEGIVIIRRTQKGKKFIENIAERHRNFWNKFYTIAVIVSFPVMIITAMIFFSFIINLIQEPMTPPPASLVVPGAVPNVVQSNGLLILPWWLWVIGIFSVMIPHEFSHGIASRLAKIRITSLGWLLLLFLPGAFCEPDEKQLKKASRMNKLKVYAAGSFANMVFAIPFLIISYLIYTSIFFEPCLSYDSNLVGYSMANASAAGCIFSVNGSVVSSPEEMSKVLTAIPAGSTINIHTLNGSYNITTVSRPDGMNGSFIGISGPYQSLRLMKIPALEPIASLLLLLGYIAGWIAALNIGIAMVNLLPIKPLDGGLIMEETVKKFAKKNATKIVKSISLSMLAILLFSIIFSLFGSYILRAVGF